MLKGQLRFLSLLLGKCEKEREKLREELMSKGDLDGMIWGILSPLRITQNTKSKSSRVRRIKH